MQHSLTAAAARDWCCCSERNECFSGATDATWACVQQLKVVYLSLFMECIDRLHTQNDFGNFENFCIYLTFFFFLLSVFLFPIVLIAARHWLPLLPWLSHMLSAARPPNDRRACKLVCQFWNRELPVKCRHTNTHKMKLCGVKDGGAEWVTDGSTVSLFTH